MDLTQILQNHTPEEIALALLNDSKMAISVGNLLVTADPTYTTMENIPSEYANVWILEDKRAIPVLAKSVREVFTTLTLEKAIEMAKQINIGDHFLGLDFANSKIITQLQERFDCKIERVFNECTRTHHIQARPWAYTTNPSDAS